MRIHHHQHNHHPHQKHDHRNKNHHQNPLIRPEKALAHQNRHSVIRAHLVPQNPLIYRFDLIVKSQLPVLLGIGKCYKDLPGAVDGLVEDFAV